MKSPCLLPNINVISLCLLQLLIVQAMLEVSSYRESGIYVDNYDNQTILERWLSANEKADLEQRILRLLGLPDKPKILPRKSIVKRSAPTFLQRVYEYETGPKTYSTDGEFRINEKTYHTINQSNVIISFTAHQPHKGLGGKPDKVKRMWFNVSTVPTDNQILSAELKLYRDIRNRNSKFHGDVSIAAYQVLRDSGKKFFQIINSVNITAEFDGWITLDITQSLRSWTKSPEENHGLKLMVTPIVNDQLNARRMKPENIGIVGFKGESQKQPFMVGFYDSPSNLGPGLTNGNRFPRSVRGDLKTARSQNVHAGLNMTQSADQIRMLVNDFVRKHPRGLERPRSLEEIAFLRAKTYEELGNVGSDAIATGVGCGRRNLYVNFQDTQWRDLIIAPSGYDAFYCSGTCTYPLDDRMNPKPHAIIMSLMHLMRPHVVPSLCCTPTKYSPLTVLYYLDESENVILKKYEDMVVERCGCS